MIEVSKPQLEEATEEELKENENKIQFPLAGLIIIGVLIVLIIACLITIFALEA